MTGKEKFVIFLANLKQLPVSRQKYWLAKVKALRAKIDNAELGDEIESQSDWLLDTANWLDKVYNYVGSLPAQAQNAASDLQLQMVNELDKVYTAVSDEVVKIPGKTNKALTDLTGTSLWPWYLGIGIGLGAYLYLTQASPLKKLL
jgi:hypothetical protein